MWSALRCIIVRDLTLAMRRRADVLTTLFFFIMVVSLFPLGVGPEMKILRVMGAGVVWVAALLASMLATIVLVASTASSSSETSVGVSSRSPLRSWLRRFSATCVTLVLHGIAQRADALDGHLGDVPGLHEHRLLSELGHVHRR